MTENEVSRNDLHGKTQQKCDEAIVGKKTATTSVLRRSAGAFAVGRLFLFPTTNVILALTFDGHVRPSFADVATQCRNEGHAV